MIKKREALVKRNKTQRSFHWIYAALKVLSNIVLDYKHNKDPRALDYLIRSQSLRVTEDGKIFRQLYSYWSVS